MARYNCNICKKPITFGVFQYSGNNFNQPLCMTCQDNVRRTKEIKEGNFEKFEEKHLKCRRCGKEFSSPQEKPDNPFSTSHRHSDLDISDAANSDHYD